MRKAYRFLAAALSLVLCTGLQSCHNEKISSGYPILFRCADVTRAEATITDLQDNGFDVNAYFTANGSEFSFTKSLSYDNVSGIWGYNDIEYWLPGATYYFKALYPTDAGTIDNSTSAQSLTISNFDVTSQTDLLVAETEAIVVDASIGSPTGGSVVNLQFKHLLACVEIKIKSSINVTINKITLNDIENFCKYSNGWQSNGNRTDLEITSDVELTPGADAQSVTGSILVVPIMTGYETITIEASNKTYSNISLPENTSWKNGRKYTYVAEIKQNDIIFNEPSVKVWDSESATGSVIIQ